MEVLASLWTVYFPKDVFNPEDARVESISVLLKVFEADLVALRCHVDFRKATVSLDTQYILDLVPFEDFINVLTSQPSEVVGCMVSDYDAGCM